MERIQTGVNQLASAAAETTNPDIAALIARDLESIRSNTGIVPAEGSAPDQADSAS